MLWFMLQTRVHGGYVVDCIIPSVLTHPSVVGLAVRVDRRAVGELGTSFVATIPRDDALAVIMANRGRWQSAQYA